MIRHFRDLYTQKRLGFCSVPGCKNARSLDGIELDHVDPTTKIKEVSAFGWWASKPERAVLYEAELAKCVPLCVHHHREKTSRDRWKGASRHRHAKELYYRNAKYERGKCRECNMHVLEENEFMFDFHHRSPTTKTKNCSQLKYAKRERLETELLKCHLLCVECHKQITRRGTVESKYFVHLNTC